MNLRILGYLKLTWEMQDRLLGIIFRLCLGSQRPEGGVVLGLDYHVSDFHMLLVDFHMLCLFHVGLYYYLYILYMHIGLWNDWYWVILVYAWWL